MTSDPRAPRIEDLRAEARYARERRDLYRAKMYGSGLTTPQRLAELERVLAGAVDRLRLAESRLEQPQPTPPQ